MTSVTRVPIVLDASGLEALARVRPPARLRAVLQVAAEEGRELLAPTIICAELARGRACTRALEAAVGRHHHRSGERPSLRLVDTDFALARQVGAILEATDSGSERIVDAHVVAVAALAGGALVFSSDPADLAALADAVPAVRITVRSPN